MRVDFATYDTWLSSLNVATVALLDVEAFVVFASGSASGAFEVHSRWSTPRQFLVVETDVKDGFHCFDYGLY